MSDELVKAIRELESNERLEREKYFFQHGNTTVYEHRICVAQVSLYIASKLKVRVNEKNLMRGALLHDYFLYDWHDKNKEHCMHGLRVSPTSIARWKNQ